ncbi:acyl-CoA dehydrogenase family protein, partial [Myxococcota bacterium]|nr:acyl-CoA dehydrogenase family protein [Myxococcota bacterium]
MIEFEPSEEQALIIETVHQFAENEIRPRSREADESGVPPAALLTAAHELGLVANGLPEVDGGGGARSALTGALIAEELGWGDMALALAILSPGLVGFPVADHGSQALKKKLLPGLLGPAFVPGALALVEPRFDFDVYRPETTAGRDGDAYRLDGRKCHVPWLAGGGHVVVIAQEPGTGSLTGRGSLAAFVVARDAAGLKAEPEQNMGLCGLPTAELGLAGVRVPAECRLAASDADLRRLIERGRIAIAATALGAARAAFEVARDYAKQRETFGQPIATRQAIAFKLADMAI